MRTVAVVPGLALGLFLFLSLSASAVSEEDVSQKKAEPPRGLVANEAAALPGYTLFSPLLSSTTYLVDMEGQVVHTWPSRYPAGNGVYLLDNGGLLRGCRLPLGKMFAGGGIAGRVEEMDWDGDLVWEFEYATSSHWHHHDIEPLPSGNILMIAWEHKTREEALARGRDPEALDEEGLWPDHIIEIRPTPPEGAKIVWEWHVWDHLVQDRDPGLPGYGKVADHPELLDINADVRQKKAFASAEPDTSREEIEKLKALGYVADDEEETGPEGPLPRWMRLDWLHTNAVNYDARLDQIAISMPKLNEIWILDHSTTTREASGHTGGKSGKGGDILFRYGNPLIHGRGGKDDRRLFEQHDIRWIPEGLPGAGNLTVFNNGNNRPGGAHSSVEEIRPFSTGGPVWSYTAPTRTDFFSSFISGAHRLRNGNTLVCSGEQGRIFEVTRDGRIVWEYWNPYGGEIPYDGMGEPPPPEPSPGKEGAPAGPPGVPKVALFRATRIPLDHPALLGKDLDPR